MLYFIFQAVKRNEPFGAFVVIVVSYIAIVTLMMIVYTIFSVTKSIKRKLFIWEVKALLPFWIGWVAFLIVENIPSHNIGAGFAPLGPYEHLIFFWPIYFPFALYGVIAPWILLFIIVVKFIVKRSHSATFTKSNEKTGKSDKTTQKLKQSKKMQKVR